MRNRRAVTRPSPAVQSLGPTAPLSAKLQLRVYMKPEPQGSSRAFVIPGTNRASITTANSKMKPFRSEVTQMARYELAQLGFAEPMFGKHIPVRVTLQFAFLRPAGAKYRLYPSVKPDIDKLQRAILDALTGVAFLDDAQVVSSLADKVYDGLESASILVEAM